MEDEKKFEDVEEKAVELKVDDLENVAGGRLVSCVMDQPWASDDEEGTANAPSSLFRTIGIRISS